jgi:hypothetical protein
VPDRGPDHGGVIERGVEPDQDLPGAAWLAGRADRLGGQAGGAAGGARVPAAEPDRVQDGGGARTAALQSIRPYQTPRFRGRPDFLPNFYPNLRLSSLLGAIYPAL